MPPSHACEACRKRKVKCDGAEPCANCCISEFRCLYSGVPRKRVRAKAKTQVEAATAGPILNVTPDGADVSVHGLHPGGGAPLPLQPLPDDVYRRSSRPFVSPGSVPLYASTIGGHLSTASSFHLGHGQIYASLAAQVDALLGPETLMTVAIDCIEDFVQYLFPNTPIAHEPALRDAAALLAPGGNPTPSALSSSSDSPQRISYLRKFTLITALCAYVTAVIPKPRLSEQRVLLSRVFLAASRATLQLYEEYDLEHPDSTSLSIRIWYSAAMQNGTGRIGPSCHYHAEASAIAQRLRLYSEGAIRRDSLVESKLLRAIFWLLFLANKTSIALETRPPNLVEQYFDCDFDLHEDGEPQNLLLDPDREVSQSSLEERIFVGFHLRRRIWAAAADMVAGIKSFSRQKRQRLIQPADEDLRLARLTEAYLSFTSLIDELPSWLRQPESITAAGNEGVASYQRTCFWTQKSSIMTVFHCMKLVILQKCIDSNLPAIVGLDGHPLACATRKIEISQGFLYELQMVPLVCFKVQGEPAVERIRRVGSMLLELIQHANNTTIKKVAKSQFEQLLDLLAKLDSMASDGLVIGS